MGKKILALCMAMSLLTFMGCGDSEKVIGGDVVNMSAGGSVGEPSPEQESAQPLQQESVQAPTTRGYVFVTGGVTVEVDADMAPILAALGEPASYFEAASCAFEGLDKIYTYSSFEIDTYPAQDRDLVSAVILKDDSVTTAEGVCIGDSLEKLQEIYGEGSVEEGMLIYEKDGVKLCFILRDDSVISIEYRSTVL
ncbi:MAG: hypothetical protein NC543_14750 [bacterium]|nr:hypothetical protein [bacterium]MCM1376567.1 hypothetical protein [Muribaculum sp.]